MPNVINATSTGNGGLISTGDDSGVLNIQTNEVTAVSVDALQNVTFTNSANLPNTFGFKNRLINGAMVIDQRNAGASVTVNSAAALTYSVDRFYGYGQTSDGVFTLQQNSSVPTGQGFTYSLKATVTTADASIGSTQIYQIGQRIEGYNVADFGLGTASASTFTFSFWVRSSLTGTFGGALMNGGQNRSYPFSYTISAADTWEKKTVTLTGDTSGTWLTTNGTGLDLIWGLGVGSTYLGTANTWAGSYLSGVTGQTQVMSTVNATFYITGVQLEKGSTATSFDYRPYGTELILCQRYYQKTYDIGSAPGTNTGASYWNAGSTVISSTTTWGASWRFPVELRTTPTATAYTTAGTAGSLTFSQGNAQGEGAVTEFGKGSKAVSFYHNGTASGLTTGGGVVMIGHIVVSAEL